ncbi:hypothetical protein EJ03DRAFT_260937, partial [Teratosphaeria nubilosa]
IRTQQSQLIEEVSMIDCQLFDILDQICRTARNVPDKPFGGLQVVVVGDFFQMPPVKPFQHCTRCGAEPAGWYKANHAPYDRSIRVYVCTMNDCERLYYPRQKRAFFSEAWSACGFKYIKLERIHRQLDPEFQQLLLRRRQGGPLSSLDRLLLLRQKNDPPNATYLYPRARDVHDKNREFLDALSGKAVVYQCSDFYEWDRTRHPEHKHWFQRKRRNDATSPLKVLSEHRYKETCEYKKHSRGILLTTLDRDRGLVNGAQGKIVGFE